MRRLTFRPHLEEIESRTNPAPVTNTVTGSLLLNSTALSVSGVPVQLSGMSEGGVAVNASAVSNGAGNFTFENVLPGQYFLQAGNAPGIVGVSSRQAVAVTSGPSPVQRNLSFTGGLGAKSLSLRSFLNVPNLTVLQFPTGGTGTALAAERPDAAPTSTPIGDATKTTAEAADPEVIGLAAFFSDDDTTNSEVAFHISDGGIEQTLKVTLLDSMAPQTVANFLDYVNAGEYTDALFTRNAENFDGSKFVLQGGGAKINAAGTAVVPTALRPPIENEFAGVSNLVNTLAMAQSGGDIDSATNQFFFNTGNNAGLDASKFVVFAKVDDAESRNVLATLSAAPTRDLSGNTALKAANPSVLFNDFPLLNYPGTDAAFPAGATRDNYMFIRGVTIERQDEKLTYSASSDSTLVTATVQGSKLVLTYAPGTVGTATITVTATDRFGIRTTQTFDRTVE